MSINEVRSALSIFRSQPRNNSAEWDPKTLRRAERLGALARISNSAAFNLRGVSVEKAQKAKKILSRVREETALEKVVNLILEKKEFAFKAKHKNPKGGLNAAGRKAYNRATGSNLKAPQPEGGSRRDSFCARMKGMKRKLTSAKTANDPNSRINKSLRAWNC